jgi:hypothetical protein
MWMGKRKEFRKKDFKNYAQKVRFFITDKIS